MPELLRLGPLGWRVLLSFLLVASVSIGALVVVTAVGVDVTRASATRAEREHVVDDMAALAATRFEAAGAWQDVDLATVERSAELMSAHLIVVDPADQVVIGGPVGRGFRAKAVSAPVVVAGDQVGTAYLSFFDDAPEFSGGLTTAWVAWAALIAIVVAFVVAVIFTRRLTRPLADLTVTTRAFANNDRSARALVDKPGELGELARTFNDMADEVVRSEAARRRMSADVAHELRTPLTALQAGLEELRDGHLAAEPETLSALYDQSVRMGRVVEDLSALARAESPNLVLTRTRLDLSDLVSDVLLVWRPRIAEAGVELGTSLRMGVHVDADGDRIHEVVVNLISNALRFCSEGGSIDVSVQEQGGSALLVVRDTGVGISAEDLPYVLDRFYRGGTGERSGSGIGLALVRALVVAHGGEVDLESELGRGTTVTVRLPLAE
jgi:two-component system sensor histidine kinase BaeS